MTSDTLRSVTIERLELGRYRATNARGGTLEFGAGGDGTSFSSVELLLTALAGCSSADVDHITSRRAEPDTFTAEARAHKVRDQSGNHLDGIELTLRIRFPEGAEGDEARRMLPRAVQQSHDRLCTVSQTLQRATPVNVTAV